MISILGSAGGFIIPMHSKSANEMKVQVSCHGRKQLSPSLHRRQHLQILLEQRSEIHRNQCCEQFSAETSMAEQCACKSNPRLVMTSNQLKRHVKFSKRDTIKTKNDWKQGFPEQGGIRRIPRVERNKNMKIQDMLFTEIGVLLVSKAVELVVNIELNCWRKRNEKKRLRLLL